MKLSRGNFRNLSPPSTLLYVLQIRGDFEDETAIINILLKQFYILPKLEPFVEIAILHPKGHNYAIFSKFVLKDMRFQINADIFTSNQTLVNN
jgi:hypothetical protein